MPVVGAYRVEAISPFASCMRVRSLALVGNGWHPSLFREEAKALLGPIEALHPRLAFVTQTDTVLDRILGASLVDDVLHSTSRLWTYDTEVTSEEVATYVEEWAGNFLPSGSFAVRARKLGLGITGLSRKEIENMVGERVSGEYSPVDLENPDHEVVVILAGREEAPSHWDDAQQNQLVLWGIRDSRSRGSYTGASPTQRPFFKPVSLDPRLARLMVSLSLSGNPTSTVVDPFCGTGGIAIEASMLGMEVLASDLDSRMVEGTLSNLEWAQGLGGYSVEKRSADEIHNLWGAVPGCSFVFDPPYGRNAWSSDDGLGVLLGALESARKMSPRGTVCTMLPSSPDALGGPVSDDLLVMGTNWGKLRDSILKTGWRVALCSPVRVHRSLSRLVVLCHPAD